MTLAELEIICYALYGLLRGHALHLDAAPGVMSLVYPGKCEMPVPSDFNKGRPGGPPRRLGRSEQFNISKLLTLKAWAIRFMN
jgi:hypothetical protein